MFLLMFFSSGGVCTYAGVFMLLLIMLLACVYNVIPSTTSSYFVIGKIVIEPNRIYRSSVNSSSNLSLVLNDWQPLAARWTFVIMSVRYILSQWDVFVLNMSLHAEVCTESRNSNCPYIICVVQYFHPPQLLLTPALSPSPCPCLVLLSMCVYRFTVIEEPCGHR